MRRKKSTETNPEMTELVDNTLVITTVFCIFKKHFENMLSRGMEDI